MDVILHLGAHRTGSTTFQSYVNHNLTTLKAQSVEFWGPRHVRRDVFSGFRNVSHTQLARNTHARALGRVRMHLDKLAKGGVKTLLVSDENMLGSVRANLRARSLYPAAGERVARLAPAFEGGVKRVVLHVRAQDTYWASSAAFGVARGHPMLRAIAFREIVANRRRWRDVITDIYCAMPNVEISVLPFERFAGRPDAVLRCMTGNTAPADTLRQWLNKAPDAAQLRAILKARAIKSPELDGVAGRWHPFDAEQRARLCEDYADDMLWLAAGADGMATLTEDKNQTRAGIISPAGFIDKGHGHDIQERHMAQPG